MRYENDPKRVQHKYAPLRTMLPPLPKETGNLTEDYRALRQWLAQLGVAMEYALEHLTVEQFADGELEKIGGVKNG